MIAAIAMILSIEFVPPANWQMYGAATQSCGAWTSHKADDGWARTGDFHWLAGFLSGLNLANGGDITGTVDMLAAVAYVDKFCAENPLDEVGLAASFLAKELYERAP